MAYALDYQNLAGSFVEAEFGHTFEYRVRQDKTNYRADLPHLIYVGDNQTRFAKVLKTVAYVLCDEHDLQKWAIKRHREFTKGA